MASTPEIVRHRERPAVFKTAILSEFLSQACWCFGSLRLQLEWLATLMDSQCAIAIHAGKCMSPVELFEVCLPAQCVPIETFVSK